MARLAVILAVPVVGELDRRRLAAQALLAVADEARIRGPGEEHQRVAVLLVLAPAHLLQAELVAVEVERGVEIAHAQHGMKISHDGLSGWVRAPAGSDAGDHIIVSIAA